MTESPEAPKPTRSMPRPAIRAIAWSGHFCGVMTCFLVYFAVRHGFHACMARIVGGHEASIALHPSCGFEIVGTEREIGRKFGGRDHTTVMHAVKKVEELCAADSAFLEDVELLKRMLEG